MLPKIARRLLLSAALGLGCAGAGVLPVVPPARAAEDPAAALARALLLPEMLAVMQEEGRAYGADLDADFLDGAGGAAWAAEVDRIYDPATLLPVFQTAFAEDLGATGADPAPMLAFFASPLGQRIVTLELSARRALVDDRIEDASRQRLEEMRASGESRLALLEDYVAANHLIDMNVSSALNANMAFMRGLAEAGAFGGAMSEEEMLAQVWSQEDEVRRETEDWMLAFVAMAYAPLSDAELGAYTAFSTSPEGAALNRALFAAFDAIFLKVSHDLGRAVGARAQGTDL
jgi:hypothetical protein